MTNRHELKQLFGLSNNDTTGFYLKTLYDAFIETTKIGITKSFGVDKNLLPVKCRARFFVQMVRGLPSDDDLHPEWQMFASLLTQRLGGKNEENFNSINGNGNGNDNDVNPEIILDIIRSHAGINMRDQHQFAIEIIKAHISDLKNADIRTPGTWSGATGFTFKNSFDDIFTSAAGFRIDTINLKPFKIFSYKLNKYNVKETMTVAGEATDDFWTKNDIKEDNIYRSKSDPLKLYKVGNDGNSIDIDVGSNIFKESTKGGNSVTCKNFALNDTDKNACSDFLTKCIIDGTPNDISKCKQFLFDPNFWSNITDEINNMLPYYITRTLDTFGFKTVTNSTTFLIEYQSLSKWFEDLTVQIKNGALKRDEYENIAKNTRLTQYLTRLVDKVNLNPAILNENYVGAIIPAEDLDLPYKNTHFYRIGLRAKRHSGDNTLVNFTRQSNIIVSNFNYLRRNSQYRMNIGPSGLMQNGLLYTIPYNRMMRGQFGGGILIQPVSDNNIIQSVDKLPFKQYPELKAMASSLEERMKIFGKHFSKTTKEHLERELNAYRTSEEKLFKAIKYVYKYIDLLSEKQYDKENYLTLTHLEDFVNEREKYFNRTETGQSNLINTMLKLAETVTDDLTAKVDLADSTYQPIKKNV